MRAVIPVAGVGTRLRPHTHTQPKVLLNVAGKPILGHILDELMQQNITRCTIVVGYMRELVEEYVRTHYDFDVTFIHQERRLGLGHSIWMARETFNNEPLLIILGDTIFDVDLRPILNSQHSSLGVKAVEDPRRFGVAHVNDRGFVSKLIEKPEQPETNLALVGLYYIKNPQILASTLEHLIENDLRTRGEYQLTDALQLMLDRQEEITTFPVDGWYDCGKAETLLATNRHLLGKAEVNAPQGQGTIVQPSYVAPDAIIRDSIIGPYATVADGAEIEGSIIRNSIVGSQAVVKSSLLEDSIIGSKATVSGKFSRVNIGDSSAIDFTC